MLKTKQDAVKYLNDVRLKLKELKDLSSNAGLNTHAAMWIAIEASFLGGLDNINNMISAVMVQNELAMQEFLNDQF